MKTLNTTYQVAKLALIALAINACGREELAQSVPTPSPEVPAAATGDAPVIATALPEPTPTGTPVATPTATPNPTTVTYIYQDITICSALHSWNPNTTTIKTYATSANSDAAYFLLRYDGAFIVAPGGCEAGCVAPDQDLIRSNISGTVCTIQIRNGQFAGVTP